MTQEYVLEVPGQYPRRMVFNLFGEDRIKLHNIQVGEDLTVQFDIDAREYNGRWFNDIRAYNIIRGVAPVAAVPGEAPISGTTPFPPQQPMASETTASPFPPQQAAPAPEASAAPFPPAQEPAGDGSTDDLPF